MGRGCWRRDDQAGHVVQQLAVGAHGDLMPLDDADRWSTRTAGFGAHAVPDLPQPQRLDVAPPGHDPQAGLGGVDQGRVDGVHQRSTDICDRPRSTKKTARVSRRGPPAGDPLPGGAVMTSRRPWSTGE